MKPKINGRIVAVFFLLCLTVFVGSCIVEESFFENDSSMDQALVMEAEEWYRENLLPLPSDNARTSRSNSLIDGNPLWNKAKTLQHKGRQVIEIPVRMKVSELFAGKGLEYRKHSNDYRLLLFKLKNGKFRPYLFKVELDSKDSKTKIRDFKDLDLTNIPSSFSGNYSFFSLDGRFVGSWEIQNGERLRAQSFKGLKPGKGKGNENERTSTVEYHCTVTTYTTYVQAGDGEPQIVEQYEVWDCEFTFIPETVAPPSSTDPDNGGTDPGCYEPHPDFEGFMVPCDQKDPCNNFEDLISKVLNTEGGFVDDPVDLGGATNRGVAWHTWQKAAMPVLGKEATLENLKQLTASEATEIYKALYWDSIKLSEIKDGDLRGLIFDFHVHSGPNAVKVLQKLLNELGGNLIVDGIMGEKTIKFLNEYDNIINLYNGFKQKRLEFLKGIVDRSVDKYKIKNPNATDFELKQNTQLRFDDGWKNRVNEFNEKTTENYLNVNC